MQSNLSNQSADYSSAIQHAGPFLEATFNIGSAHIIKLVGPLSTLEMLLTTNIVTSIELLSEFIIMSKPCSPPGQVASYSDQTLFE
jgi:hypothetical protein